MGSAGEGGNGEGVYKEEEGKVGDELAFFSAWFCPFAQRAWIALEEKKVPYRHVEVDPYDKPAELMAVNPRGLVPAISHKGKSLFESMIIVEYIDEAFPRGSLGTDGLPRGALMPLEPYDRAIARIWLDYINKYILRTFIRILMVQDPEGQAQAKLEYTNHIKELSGAMAELSPTGPFFMGKELGIVDVALAPFMARHFVLNHYRQFALDDVPELAHFHTWASAVLDRPSVKATLQDEAKLIEMYEKYANNTATSQGAIAVNKNLPLP